MIPVLTVTLNPALDLSTHTAVVQQDAKLRCETPVQNPGGGGVNVARAMRYLGGDVDALVALGGATGSVMRQLLEQENLPLRVFDTPGDTRQCLSVIADETGAQYRFVTPGPQWGPGDASRFMMTLGQSIKRGGLVVLSGSQPPGLSETFPRDMAKMVEMRGARMLLDTSGPALTRLLDAGLGPAHLLRLDRAESNSLARRTVGSPEKVAHFGRTLVQKGVAGAVIQAMGAEGSILVTASGAWHAKSPSVPVLSKTGAGDSFVAGFALAHETGASLPEALRFGVAAASAAVMSDATELCRAADVETLLPQTTLKDLRLAA